MQTVRNVTFSLPVDLLRRGKMLAAENDISLNALVKDALTQAIDRSVEYRAAGERLLELAASRCMKRRIRSGIGRNCMSELGFFDTKCFAVHVRRLNEVKCQASIDLFHRSIDATSLPSALRWCRTFTSRQPRKLRLDGCTAHSIIASLCECTWRRCSRSTSCSYWDAKILAAA